MANYRVRSRLLGGVLLAAVLLSATPALARWRSSGEGGCGEFVDAVTSAQPGDVLTPMYEPEFGRNTNGATIAVNLEVEGGWSVGTASCNSTNSFDSPEAMRAAGFTFDPANRSGLTSFGAPVLRVDAGVTSVQLRNLNLLLDQQVSGDGGILRVAGAAAGPRLSGASVTIQNTAFRPNFGVEQLVGAEGDGGGLFLDLDARSRLTIRDSLFKDQIAGGRGGGFAIVVRGGSQVTIERTLVEGSRAGSCGGGLITIHSGTVTLQGNTFQNNGADGAVADLCVERPAASAGPAALYLADNSFSEGGLQVDAGVTVFDERVALPLLSR